MLGHGARTYHGREISGLIVSGRGHVSLHGSIPLNPQSWTVRTVQLLRRTMVWIGKDPDNQGWLPWISR
jgi:hypothetical protein